MESGHIIYGLAAKISISAAVLQLLSDEANENGDGVKVLASDRQGNRIGECAAGTLDELQTN
jgi:hypothetical protein